ncbi:hypothetical protein K438DRAFT_493787 [Mycena galopus ATCC 62051]|nr:hypothetical protein K438DRAFT_493787 [Mycena galopus ATCC 62051]
MPLSILPDDIQCKLLSFLPNFSVLHAVLLTSRSFHSVFLTRRDLVLKHVAENLLGLALGEELIGDSENASEPSSSSYKQRRASKPSNQSFSVC